VIHVVAIPVAYRWLITFAFIALIIVFSITPGRDQAGDSVFVWLVVNATAPIQKLMHFVCYAAVAVLWAWTLEAVEPRLLRLLLALALTVGLGATLEWYQTQVPGRFGTLADAILNAVGAVVGVIIAILVL